MRKLRKLWASPRRFKALLAEAFLRLSALSVFRILPVPGRAQRLTRGHRLSHTRHTPPSSQEICHAVNIAAHYVPGASCLVKAQAGNAMLNRFGYAAEIKIGVARESSYLRAHAWVEWDGRVVLGATRNQYVELLKSAPADGRLQLPGA